MAALRSLKGRDKSGAYNCACSREAETVAEHPSLREVAEHALLEMRDRFDLGRGDSVSLDALEDALAAQPDRVCKMLDAIPDFWRGWGKGVRLLREGKP